MNDLCINLNKDNAQKLSKLCVDILADKQICKDSYKGVCADILYNVIGEDIAKPIKEAIPKKEEAQVKVEDKAPTIKQQKLVMPKISLPEEFNTQFSYNDVKKEYGLSLRDENLALIRGEQDQIGIKYTLPTGAPGHLFMAKEDANILLNIIKNISSNTFYSHAKGEEAISDDMKKLIANHNIRFSYIKNNKELLNNYNKVVMPQLSSLALVLPVYQSLFVWKSAKKHTNMAGYYEVSNKQYVDGRNYTIIKKVKENLPDEIVEFENIRLVKILGNFIEYK